MFIILGRVVVSFLILMCILGFLNVSGYQENSADKTVLGIILVVCSIAYYYLMKAKVDE